MASFMDFFSVSVQLNLFLGVPVERVTALHKRAAQRGFRSLIRSKLSHDQRQEALYRRPPARPTDG
jgi:hypothetical protein